MIQLYSVVTLKKAHTIRCGSCRAEEHTLVSSLVVAPAPPVKREKDLVSQVHCTEARRGCDEASDIEPIDDLDRPAAQLGRASTSDHPYRGWTGLSRAIWW